MLRTLCPAIIPGEVEMIAEAENVIRNYYRDAFGEGRMNLAVIDQYMAADFTYMAADLTPHYLSRHQDGREAYKQYMSMFAMSFAEMDRLEVCDIFSRNDKVVARWSWQGKHTGEFMGVPATQRQVTIRGVDIFRLTDRVIVDLWQEIDLMRILQQIMALPS